MVVLPGCFALFLLLAQDLQQLLDRADKILEETKASYESAKAKNSADGFTDASFKLEDARIKYQAVQEFAKDEMLKTVQERLKIVGQLGKLIHDGKVAITGNAPPPKEPSAPPTAAPVPAPAVPPAPEPPTARMARSGVPDSGKLRDVEKVVRDTFKAEYAKKQPSDRQALARKLLQQGLQVRDDPAACWVLLHEAQDLATQVSDAETVLEALQGMIERFEIDGLVAKTAALSALAKSARSPEDSGRLAEQYLKLADEAAASDNYEAADKAVGQALAAARKSNAPLLQLKVVGRQKEITDLKTRFDKVRRALDALAKDPADPAANLEIGQFLCFSKGDWEAGIVFLSKSSDPVLGPLANRDILKPSQPERQIEIADGWWDLAEKEKSEARKQRLSARAASWYEQAVATAVGLLKTKAQNRLDILKKRSLAAGLTCLLGARGEGKGIELRFNDDGKSEAAVIGGKPCVKLVHNGNPVNGASYLYLDVVEPWQENWPAELEIEYFDDGGSVFDLEFDAVSAVYKNCGKTVTVGTSKTWKTAIFQLSDPAFRNRLNAASDIRVRRDVGGDFYIHRVTLRLVAK